MDEKKCKVVLELDSMPETCLDCPINDYTVFDDGDELFCQFLQKEVNGFFDRDEDCPLKTVQQEELEVKEVMYVSGA